MEAAARVKYLDIGDHYLVYNNEEKKRRIIYNHPTLSFCLSRYLFVPGCIALKQRLVALWV